MNEALEIHNLVRSAFTQGSGSRTGGFGSNGTYLAHTSTLDRANLFEAGDAVAWVPTQEITICLGYEKRDATLRGAGAFGVGNNTNAERCQALIPFTDGTVYWDFGGVTEDATRESVAGLTTSGYHSWGFTSGPRGMEIWQDGLIRSSNSANPTRSSSAVAYQLGHAVSVNSDLANYYWVFMHRTQLPFELLRRVLLDPYNTILAPPVPRRRVFPWKSSVPTIISPSGIASVEAFGSHRVGDMTVPSITSAEVFGTATLIAGDIAPAGIESEELVSDGEIIDTPGAAGTITLTTGIASGEGFGTAELTDVATIYPTGIPSSFAVDLHSVGVAVGTIAPFGIRSEEHFADVSRTVLGVPISGTTVYELRNPPPPAAGTVTTKRLCSPLELIRAERYAGSPNPAFILPDVYGDFRVGGLRGPIPAVLVTQSSPWVFIAAAHPVKEITNVYVDDVEATSGFVTIPAFERIEPWRAVRDSRRERQTRPGHGWHGDGRLLHRAVLAREGVSRARAGPLAGQGQGGAAGHVRAGPGRCHGARHARAGRRRLRVGVSRRGCFRLLGCSCS